MTTPLFHLTSPDKGDAGLAPIQITLECLCRINEWHLRRSLRRAQKGLSDTVIPPIYASGVIHRRREPGPDDWLDVPAVLQQRCADSEDLVAWRVAELRVSGVAAEPVVGRVSRRELIARGHRERSLPSRDEWFVRCGVRTPDGKIEDPSRILGGPAGVVPVRQPSTKPLFHLTLPDTEDDAHFAPLQIALEGLTQINEWQIRRSLRRAELGLTDKVIPPLYAAGVIYREEAPGHEDWLDAPAVLKQGYADCEDLAAYRTAELRVAGFTDVEPVIKYQWIPREMMIRQGYPAHKLPGRGVWLVHCCVRWPDGRIEDPSKILGMGGNFMEKI